MSNCVHRLVLNKLAENKKVKQMHRGLNWSSLQKARTDVNKILVYYKTDRQKSKPKPEYVKKVSSFYNQDHISRKNHFDESIVSYYIFILFNLFKFLSRRDGQILTFTKATGQFL